MPEFTVVAPPDWSGHLVALLIMGLSTPTGGDVPSDPVLVISERPAGHCRVGWLLRSDVQQMAASCSQHFPVLDSPARPGETLVVVTTGEEGNAEIGACRIARSSRGAQA